LVSRCSLWLGVFGVVGGGFAGLQSLLLPAFAALLVFAFLATSVKVVREHERAVVFRLGRLLGVRGPGLLLLIPFVDSMVKVDLRAVVADVPEQKAITRDGVAVGVDAAIYYRVVDPARAVAGVGDCHKAVLIYGQAALRDVVGRVGVDDLLAGREEVGRRLQELLDQVAGAWGVKVMAVALKDVRLPEGVLRAMAERAEAERWRRARIVEAGGGGQAATVHEKHPVAGRLRELQTLVDRLRELQTLASTAREKNSAEATPATPSSSEATGTAAGTPGARVRPHDEGGTGGG
jgi:regulator of protease activity HflC (stomatin/prohibitin superfamily)